LPDDETGFLKFHISFLVSQLQLSIIESTEELFYCFHIDFSLWISLRSFQIIPNVACKSNPGKTIYNVPSLVKFALPSVATLINIQAGQNSAGLRSPNQETFKEDDFLPASVTGRP
jgi:hypothetical protein